MRYYYISIKKTTRIKLVYMVQDFINQLKFIKFALFPVDFFFFFFEIFFNNGGSLNFTGAFHVLICISIINIWSLI